MNNTTPTSIPEALHGIPHSGRFALDPHKSQELHLPHWMQTGFLHDQSDHSEHFRRYRTIWISDTHLGSRGCKADLLCDFLKHNDCETLYLVGDIIDGWRMRKGVYWPQSHTNVLRRILTRSKRGTRVIYVTGNHDEFLRRYSGMSFGNIHLVDEAIHHAPNGARYWVVHGDNFDSVVQNQKWLALLGDWAYELALKLNTLLNRTRHRMGYGYWSLSAYLKYRVKKAVSFISRFEYAVAKECNRRGLQGVFCGHIHHPEIRDMNGITYCNSGDWVESCSALVEDQKGNLSIVHWHTIQDQQTQSDASPAQQVHP